MIRLNWSAVLMGGPRAGAVARRDRRVDLALAFHAAARDLRSRAALRAFRNSTMTKYSLPPSWVPVRSGAIMVAPNQGKDSAAARAILRADSESRVRGGTEDSSGAMPFLVFRPTAPAFCRADMSWTYPRYRAAGEPRRPPSEASRSRTEPIVS